MIDVQKIWNQNKKIIIVVAFVIIILIILLIVLLPKKDSSNDKQNKLKSANNLVTVAQPGALMLLSDTSGNLSTEIVGQFGTNPVNSGAINASGAITSSGAITGTFLSTGGATISSSGDINCGALFTPNANILNTGDINCGSVNTGSKNITTSGAVNAGTVKIGNTTFTETQLQNLQKMLNDSSVGLTATGNANDFAGYQYFPTGLLMQWGTNNNGGAGNISNVKFLKAFNTVFSIVAKSQWLPNSTTSNESTIYNSSINGFTVDTNVNSAAKPGTLYWIALGN